MANLAELPERRTVRPSDHRVARAACDNGDLGGQERGKDHRVTYISVQFIGVVRKC